jgi:hypothetical protein
MILEAEDVKEIDAHSNREQKVKEDHKVKDDIKVKEEHKIKEDTKQPELKTQNDNNDIKQIEQEVKIEPIDIKSIEHSEEKVEEKNVSADLAEFNENEIAELNEPLKSEINQKVKIISNNWIHLSKYRILTKIFNTSRFIKTCSN